MSALTEVSPVVHDLVGRSVKVTGHYTWCGTQVHGELAVVREVIVVSEDWVHGDPLPPKHQTLLLVDIVAGTYIDGGMAPRFEGVPLWLDEVDTK